MYSTNSVDMHEYTINSILKGNLKNSLLKDVEYNYDNDYIQREKSKYRDIIIRMKELKDLLTAVTDENYEILFCSSHGCVLDMIHMGNEGCGSIKNLQIGTCLGQNKFGESAVSLSISLGRPINLIPTRDKNRIFDNCYEYCLPLIKYENIFAYLCIIANNDNNFSDALLADIAHYIKFNICYIDESSNKNNCYVPAKSLSNRQIQVLIRMAKGLTEYAISKELGICEATVRFHKQTIFEKLDVSCTVEAVIKAIKDRYITLNDI